MALDNERHFGSPRAFVIYTRPYPAPMVIPALFGRGFSVLERQLDADTRLLVRQLGPELLVLAIDPSQPDDLALVWQLSLTADILVVLGPGPGLDGFAESLSAGADVCLRDEDGIELFEAQLGALIRRQALLSDRQHEDQSLAIGDLVVDLSARDVTVGGVVVPVSPMEFNILAYLARNAGKTLTPHEILSAVGVDATDLQKARDIVKVYIRRIRQKLTLGDEGRDYILNIRGYGYILERREATEVAAGPYRLPPELLPLRS